MHCIDEAASPAGVFEPIAHYLHDHVRYENWDEDHRHLFVLAFHPENSRWHQQGEPPTQDDMEVMHLCSLMFNSRGMCRPSFIEDGYREIPPYVRLGAQPQAKRLRLDLLQAVYDRHKTLPPLA